MNEQIKQLQMFMKTSPGGINYNGPIDGKVNPQLQASVNILQNLIKKSLSDHPDKNISSKVKTFTILSGNNLSSTIGDIKSFLSEIEKKPKEEKQKININVKAVQQIFNSNPLGIKYNGTDDGVSNKELVQKSRLLEQAITNLTGANISGKITDGKNILTTASDLKKTFNLISDYQKFIKE